MNGRYIVNYAIAKAIENRYKSLIPINRFPAFILNIYIDPSEVDVNIHPTKQEIKFIDNNRVIGTISNIVEESIMSSLYIPKMKLKNNEKEKKEETKDIPKLFDYEESEISKDIVIKDFTIAKDSLNNSSKEVHYSPFEYSKFENININSIYKDKNTDDKTPENNIIKDEIKEDNAIIEEQKIQDDLLDINPIGRVFNTYIIAESKNEEKLYFIDQHAAHERIMYEKYKEEYENEKINIQQLMFPEIIELNNVEMNKFMVNIELFRSLGFELEEFGPNSVALRGVPMLFGTPKSKDLFLDILDNLDSNIQSNYDTKMDKIMKIACTNAIKSGDKISDIEIMALIKDLKECNNPFTCPHGRPTIIEITKKHIEKEFLRII